MSDIFGINRRVISGAIATSEMLVLSMPGGTNLLSSVSGQYTLRVEPRFELGTTHLYWVKGHAQGQMEVGRMLGDGGFALARAAGGCGQIGTITLGLGSGACYAAGGGGGLSISEAVLQTYSWQGQAGNLEVNEGATILFAKLS